MKSSIQPILVEASQWYSFSWFKKPGTDANRHHLRKHLYPKIVLWNPYSVALVTRPMMLLLQVNGRHDFWIDGYFPDAKGKPDFPVHWCETVIQRIADPVKAGSTGVNPVREPGGINSAANSGKSASTGSPPPKSSNPSL